MTKLGRKRTFRPLFQTSAFGHKRPFVLTPYQRRTLALELLIQIHVWNSRAEAGFFIGSAGGCMTRIAAGAHFRNAHPCPAQLLHSVFIHPRTDTLSLAIRVRRVQVDNANLSLLITRDRAKRHDLRVVFLAE